MPRIIIISTVLTFDYTEFVQLTSIMQSTFYPCAQMTVACFQQASQMRITSLQPLLVSNLKVVDLFLILTWHDLHAFYRSQQAWAVSPSSGSSAVYFCWWKCEDVSEGGVQACREEIDDVVWYWRAKLMCVPLRSVWTQLCDVCKKKYVGVLFLVYVWIMYFFQG